LPKLTDSQNYFTGTLWTGTPQFWGSLEGKLKFYAPVISSVWNWQLSVGKLQLFGRDLVNPRRRGCINTTSSLQFRCCNCLRV